MHRELTSAVIDPEEPSATTIARGGLVARVWSRLRDRGSTATARRERRRVSYQDIGGLRKEIERVREMIEMPLRHPELFRHLNVEPPRGVLLYGPPGSGKTLIARAVAHEAGVPFIAVNGPEVIQHGYGESEAYLRKIFQDAQEHAAAIIFIDELDAIAPNRDAVLGDVEKRVVAQLLALMDGLSSRGKIVVIAATNLPNSIDPALRRPGRFDREIGLGPPDRAGRFEILRVHTRGMPLAADVDLERVAAITHGFLGADLAALAREAGMLCARDALSRSRLDGDGLVSAECLADVKVEMSHFEAAYGEIDLSTTRDVFSEVPDVTWEDVGGLEEAKRKLREAVEWPLNHGERLRYAGLRPPKGVLLVGAPGTGKTLIAKAVAAHCRVNFIAVKGPELLSKWVGESERGIRDVFRKARQAAPSIVFFDEIDAIAPTRGDAAGGGARVSERMVGQLLLEMDSIEALGDVVVLAATNRSDLIDGALLRPGRFDVVVELPLPDQASRLAILQVHCRQRRVAADVSLERIAAAMEGRTGADLEALCKCAAMQALRDSIEKDRGRRFTPYVVESRHFEAAMDDQIGNQERRR